MFMIYLWGYEEGRATGGKKRGRREGRGSGSGIFSEVKTFIYYYDIRYVEYINL